MEQPFQSLKLTYAHRELNQPHTPCNPSDVLCPSRPSGKFSCPLLGPQQFQLHVASHQLREVVRECALTALRDLTPVQIARGLIADEPYVLDVLHLGAHIGVSSDLRARSCSIQPERQLKPCTVMTHNLVLRGHDTLHLRVAHEVKTCCGLLRCGSRLGPELDVAVLIADEPGFLREAESN